MRLLGAAGLSGPAGLAPAFAQERVFRHGSTLIEPLKYPEGFSQLAYVNRDAPKGGRIRLAALGSFDSINPFTFKGDSISTGNNELILHQQLNEPSDEYGLIAESF